MPATHAPQIIPQIYLVPKLKKTTKKTVVSEKKIKRSKLVTTSIEYSYVRNILVGDGETRQLHSTTGPPTLPLPEDPTDQQLAAARTKVAAFYVP